MSIKFLSEKTDNSRGTSRAHIKTFKLEGQKKNYYVSECVKQKKGSYRISMNHGRPIVGGLVNVYELHRLKTFFVFLALFTRRFLNYVFTIKKKDGNIKKNYFVIYSTSLPPSRQKPVKSFLLTYWLVNCDGDVPPILRSRYELVFRHVSTAQKTLRRHDVFITKNHGCRLRLG